MDKEKKISPEQSEGNGGAYTQDGASATNNKGSKNAEGAEATRGAFYKETWFIATLATIAMVSIFAILIIKGFLLITRP